MRRAEGGRREQWRRGGTRQGDVKDAADLSVGANFARRHATSEAEGAGSSASVQCGQQCCGV